MTDQVLRGSHRLPDLHPRVGVTGHRQAPKLPDEALGAVRASAECALVAVLQAARHHAADLAPPLEDRRRRDPAASGPEAPRGVIISQLAEGADRIVAEAGLAVGFSLEAVLPFAASEFEKDFATKESRDEFNALLSRATSVLALEGNPVERAPAYEAAGLVMLANVDILIAIWNGNNSDGVGGTGEIVCRAIADRVPVMWIDPSRPDMIRLSWSTAEERMPTLDNPGPNSMFHVVDPTLISTAIASALFGAAISSRA